MSKWQKFFATGALTFVFICVFSIGAWANPGHPAVGEGDVTPQSPGHPAVGEDQLLSYAGFPDVG
ncbi:hypothetical protein [Caldalkalibacillus salinus]|uniref:hypothetical protein n=1 Tax=Caldalkalibacillus salinus TaxID=2803787 RepID=UPI0019236DDD|nr:hypothetical protein [Caldalkalibacillus salinus]